MALLSCWAEQVLLCRLNITPEPGSLIRGLLVSPAASDARLVELPQHLLQELSVLVAGNRERRRRRRVAVRLGRRRRLAPVVAADVLQVVQEEVDLVGVVAVVLV